MLLCNAQQGSKILIQANKASLDRDYKKAFNLYTDYIQINTNDFRGYFNRGTSAYNAKNYSSAIKDFTKTLQLNPIFMEAYYFRGQSFYHSKKYNAAISDYSYGLLKKANNSSFLKLRADAYAARGQKDSAMMDLNQAIKNDQLSGDLYKRRAELKIQLNDIEGSLKDYNAVEKLIPSYKMVHYIKG
jgi:tetratricopeptide (TPR) repeat protein